MSINWPTQPQHIHIRRLDHARDLDLPAYASIGAAGMDLGAAIAENVVLAPGQRALIPTGISLALPVGYEAQVRPRSGLALRNGITTLNTPGTIDSDYRGEVGVILPSPEMQRRLWMMLASEADEALHQPDYSLLSNPHDPRYQNCNEYLLDVVAAAAWETTDREQIKANLTAWFEPAPIRTGMFERLLGPSVDDRIRVEDQRGRIRTTTFSALARFTSEHQLSREAYEIRAAFPDTPRDPIPAG